MKFKRKRMAPLVLVLMFITVVLLFASCQDGVGPANPFAKDTTTSSSSSSSSSASSTAATVTSGDTVTSSAADTKTTTSSNSLLSILTSFGLPVALVVLFYFILIRPQKKKEKQTSKMRNELQIGDEITTIGGIVGKVVQIKDQDQIIIETGADKNRIRIKRWAIQERNTISE